MLSRVGVEFRLDNISVFEMTEAKSRVPSSDVYK